MKIEHSDLLNEFISFWFETRINGKLCYETFLDYNEMTWKTRDIKNPECYVLAGKLEDPSNEQAEEKKVKELVTNYLQNT